MIYRDADFEHGMVCEACDQPFRDGDEIAMAELGETEDGTPIFGYNRCPRCVEPVSA